MIAVADGWNFDPNSKPDFFGIVPVGDEQAAWEGDFLLTILDWQSPQSSVVVSEAVQPAQLGKMDSVILQPTFMEVVKGLRSLPERLGSSIHHVQGSL